MNILLTIRHAISGLEENFHDHQALANFLHRVGEDIDNWMGVDRHGPLPEPTPEVVAEGAAAKATASEPVTETEPPVAEPEVAEVHASFGP